MHVPNEAQMFETPVFGVLHLVSPPPTAGTPPIPFVMPSIKLDGAAIIRETEQYGGTAADSGSRVLERHDKERLGPNRSHVLESLAQTRDLPHSVAQSLYSLA